MFRIISDKFTLFWNLSQITERSNWLVQKKGWNLNKIKFVMIKLVVFILFRIKDNKNLEMILNKLDCVFGFMFELEFKA